MAYGKMPMLNMSLFITLKLTAAGNESMRSLRIMSSGTIPPSYEQPPHAMNQGNHQVSPIPNGMLRVWWPSPNHCLRGCALSIQSLLSLATKPKK